MALPDRQQAPIAVSPDSSKPDPGRAFSPHPHGHIEIQLARAHSRCRPSPGDHAGLALPEAGRRWQTSNIVLDVSVSPNAKKTEVVGWHDGALRIRLNAPPVDGAANEALRRWLADEIKLTLANVTLLRGATPDAANNSR